MKFIERLRHPDLLRYLNCDIENIPPKVPKTKIKKLEEAERTVDNHDRE